MPAYILHTERGRRNKTWDGIACRSTRDAACIDHPLLPKRSDVLHTKQYDSTDSTKQNFIQSCIMARTKATARRPHRIVHHRGWHRTAGVPGFHSRGTYCVHYGDRANVILVPTPCALDNAHTRPNPSAESLGSRAAEGASSTSPANRSTRILDLPTEILLHIFRLLLPEGEVFHFTPTARKNIRAVSIHRISPSGSPMPHAPEDRLRSLPTLSVICSRLTDIAYTIFFGSNQFVFEIASVKITSNISCMDPNMESWHQLVNTKPDGLAPLTNIAAHYLTSLTLCVFLTSRKPEDYEWKRLEKFVRQIAEALENNNNLKTLSIQLGVATIVGRRRDSKALELTSANGLHMRIRKDDAYPRAPAETLQRLEGVITPLLALQGLKERQISGLLTDESLLVSHQGNSDGWREKNQANDVDAGRSSKRLRRH